MRKILLTVIIFSLSLFFLGAVTATYQAKPHLHFQTFNEVYQTRYGGTGTNPFTGKLVTHIGAFTIDTEGLTVQNLALFSQLDTNYEFKGPRTTGPNAKFGFRPASVVFYNNQQWGGYLDQGTKTPIEPRGVPMNGTIIVDFYLVSDEPASVFIMDGAYTHNAGQMNTFYVSFATQSDFWNATFDPMSVNGGEPGQSLPYLDGGPEFTDEEIPYGDPPVVETLDYAISVLNERSISLFDAIEDKKTKVADLQASVTNGAPNMSYALDVVFTNYANTNPFRMTLQDNSNNSPTIPYKLFFNNEEAKPGKRITWDGLSNLTKTLEIQVYGINAQAAQQALAGYYQDTIIVNVIPVDTI